jgi:hypothetical protein
MPASRFVFRLNFNKVGIPAAAEMTESACFEYMVESRLKEYNLRKAN